MSTTVLRAPSRAVALLAAAAMVASMIAFAPAAEAVDEQRLAGPDRFGTAAEISEATFEPAEVDDVIVAAGFNFPDALAGSGLAGQVGAPVLLVNDVQDTVPAATLAEINRLEPGTVHVLGGTAAVSAAVFNELSGAGDWAMNRIGGADRFETAADIAGLVDAAGDTAIVATGRAFPDALAMGPLAFAGPHPVLLTEVGSLPAATGAALAGIENVIIAGGPAAVSTVVENEIDGIVSGDVSRLEGAERTATATAIAEFLVDEAGFTLSETVVANGRDFPDALAGAPYAGSNEAPLLITNGTTDLGTGTEAFVTANAGAFDLFTFLGGPAAIPQAQVTELVQLATPTDPDALVNAPILQSAELVQDPPVGRTIFSVDYTFDRPVEGGGAITAVNFFLASALDSGDQPFAATGVGPSPDRDDDTVLRVTFGGGNNPAADSLRSGLLNIAGVDWNATRTFPDGVRNVESAVPFNPTFGENFDEDYDGFAFAAGAPLGRVLEDTTFTRVDSENVDVTYTFGTSQRGNDIEDLPVPGNQFFFSTLNSQIADTRDSQAQKFNNGTVQDSDDDSIRVRFNVSNLVRDAADPPDTADAAIAGSAVAGLERNAFTETFDNQAYPTHLQTVNTEWQGPQVTGAVLNNADDQVVLTFNETLLNGQTFAVDSFGVVYPDGSRVQVDTTDDIERTGARQLTLDFPDNAISDYVLAIELNDGAVRGFGGAADLGRASVDQSFAVGGFDFGIGASALTLDTVDIVITDLDTQTGRVDEYDVRYQFNGPITAAGTDYYLYPADIENRQNPRERIDVTQGTLSPDSDLDAGLVIWRLNRDAEIDGFDIIDAGDVTAGAVGFGAASYSHAGQFTYRTHPQLIEAFYN